MLSISGLVKAYPTTAGSVSVLDGTDLSMEAGNFVCIMGASGSGKTTLLNIIGGLTDFDTGTVRVLGHDLASISEARTSELRLHHIGMVFQDHGLVPDLTAKENIEIVLRARDFTAEDSVSAAQEALTQVGLQGLEDRFPRQLSGGQQQRVGIARALAGGKELILADEPTGALDETTSHDLFELLATLTEHGVAVLLSTHDRDAGPYAHRTLHLRRGRLQQ